MIEWTHRFLSVLALIGGLGLLLGLPLAGLIYPVVWLLLWQLVRFGAYLLTPPNTGL